MITNHPEVTRRDTCCEAAAIGAEVASLVAQLVDDDSLSRAQLKQKLTELVANYKLYSQLVVRVPVLAEER